MRNQRSLDWESTGGLWGAAIDHFLGYASLPPFTRTETTEEPLSCQRHIDTTGGFLIRVSSRGRLLPWRQGDFHATVLSPAICSLIRGYWLTFTLPIGAKSLLGHAVLCQVGCYGLSPPLRQFQVVGIRTDAISVTDNLRLQRGLLFQRLQDSRQLSLGFGFQDGLVEVKQHFPPLIRQDKLL